MKHDLVLRYLPFLFPLLAPAQDSLNVTKLFHWNDPSLPSSALYDNRYNDVWGYASDGREYAIIGSTMGTHIFDVTDAVNSVQVAFVPGAFQGVNVVHRDFKTYAGYLYAVCDEGPSTLQIIDLHDLPDAVDLVYDSSILFHRAHNIQIDTVNARLYTCGGNSPMSIWSLADPEAPTLLVDCSTDIPWWDGSIGYVHDLFVHDNVAWCNDENAMHVVDFTDPDAPQLLGSLTVYPEPGYNHSGWMNDAGTVYAMADETHGSHLKLIDATDVNDLQMLSLLGSEVDALSILHNPFFDGDLLHVAYYYDGYWLWDAADPLAPTLLGYYDTSLIPNGPSYKGAWGTYPWLPSGHVLVSDMQTGLWVLDVAQALSAGDQSAGRNGIRVWPTITDGPLNVSTTADGTGPMRIDVMDVSGKPMMHVERRAGEQDLDLGDLADGLYLVRVSFGDLVYAQRVIKRSGR